MAKYKAPRGTADVLPEDQPYWRTIQERAEALCHLHGYQRIDTPLFEEAGLFVRGVGQGTDIVEKETYTFEDRSGTLMTLRPEGTAPVCRAYLEHGLHNRPQPVRLYYFAPAFRYERPQAGRYRQHTQFGYEAIGEADPALDAEVIVLAWQLYQDLGLSGLSVQLNSIGDGQCRPGYLDALKAHYQAHLGQLCRDCKVRWEKNPLRLLDCKEAQCQPFAQTAPRPLDHLCPQCRDHFTQLQGYLRSLEVPFQLNHRLVRGLDYYTRTVFEVQPQDGGAQSTIGAGGRYDGLIEELGGRPTPAVGFATGMERIMLHLKKQGAAVLPKAQPQVYVTYLGEEAKASAVTLAQELRRAQVSALLSLGDRSLRAQLRHADALGVEYAIILGEEELRSGTVLLRRMADGEQVAVPRREVVRRLVTSSSDNPSHGGGS